MSYTGIQSYVLYRTEDGKKFHRKPNCPAQSDVPPWIDGGEEMFSELEMTRLGDVDITHHDLCKSCSGKLRSELKKTEITGGHA